MKMWTPIACAAVMAAGCSVPVPFLSGDTKPKGYDGAATGVTSFDADEGGMKYCQRLATAADVSSQHRMAWGITLATAGAAGALIGGIMGPGSEDDSFWSHRRDALVMGVSSLLTLSSTWLLTRSSDASAASATAGAAMGDDANAMARCLEARRVYVGARGELTKAMGGTVEEAARQLAALRGGYEEQVKKVDIELAKGPVAAEKARLEALKKDLNAKILEIMDREMKILVPPVSPASILSSP